MIDLNAFAKDIGEEIRDSVDELAREIEPRLKALEAKAAEPVTISVNEPPSATGEQLAAAVAAQVQKAVERLSEPRPAMSELKAMVEDAVKALPRPQDGRSVTAEEVMPALLEAVQKAVEAIPAPKDGQSVTVADLAPLIESLHAKWELDFERRAMEFHQRMLDRLPKPKDGKDGRDAVPVEDFDLSLDGHALTVSLGPVSKTIHVPFPLYRGVFKDGETYEVGDSVTFGGSQFICSEATTEKPETGKAWTLAVKRGRDGKDGKPGEKGDPGRNGKDGQDLIRPRGAWE